VPAKFTLFWHILFGRSLI
jgi:hypothetical protein